MIPKIKEIVRDGLARFGYVIRSVGHQSRVTGIDLLHDVRVLLCEKSNPVLLDVGANIGQTIDDFLQAFSAPQIFSFEPSPGTFELLRRRYGNRSGIHLENIALGHREGMLPFRVTEDYSVNDSLLRPLWNAGETPIRVRVDTVDNYCERMGIQKIDLLKIDTQGYDANVLRGALRMLKNGSIYLFFLEVTLLPMYEGQAGLSEILSLAEQTGYRLVGFYDQTYNENRIWYLNACFIRGGN